MVLLAHIRWFRRCFCMSELDPDDMQCGPFAPARSDRHRLWTDGQVDSSIAYPHIPNYPDSEETWSPTMSGSRGNDSRTTVSTYYTPAH